MKCSFKLLIFVYKVFFGKVDISNILNVESAQKGEKMFLKIKWSFQF